ncbi:MAG: hypothetical protein GYB31_12560 [Bacteroidetes bacterium]|nr:hypothetical protein [Bacteroidota bacterium]
MHISTPQYLLEFSILLILFMGCIRNLKLHPSEKSSLLAGIPILCMLLPGLRLIIPAADAGMADHVVGAVSWLEADWNILIRNLSTANLLYSIYLFGFALAFAEFLDRLFRQGLDLNRLSITRYFKTALWPSGKDGSGMTKKAIAGLSLLGNQSDSLLIERSRLKTSGSVQRAHYLEGFLLQLALLIHWWNPILWWYKNAYLAESRRELQGSVMPSRAVRLSVRDQTPKAVKRIFALSACFLLLANMPLVMPGSNPFYDWLSSLEQKSQIRYFEDLPELEPLASLSWGGHKIPLAAVHSEDDLAYEVYHMQPFELHLLRYQNMQLKVGNKKPGIQKLVGRIGVPHSDELSYIGSEIDFIDRLPRLSSMGEQTFYLRLETDKGQTWVAVIAVSESAQVYNSEGGLHAIARDVAGFKRLNEEDQKKTSPYRFTWGDMEIPLEKYASPDVYSGFIEITLDSFLQIVEEDMRFFALDSTLEIEHLSVRAYGNPAWRSVIWSPEIITNSAVLDSKTALESLGKQIGPGDEITLYGRAGSLYINTIAIRIYDPNRLYQPIIRAPELNDEPAEYDYQLINRPGYESLLRIDTLNARSQRIVDMYRGKPDYRIVHVPGFKTNERLVNSWESEMDYMSKQEDLSVYSLEYIYALPEYHGFHDTAVQLNWGEMWATPNSEVYEPDEYELNRRESISLKIGEESFAIEKALVDFVQDGKVKGMYLLNEEDLLIPHVLPKAGAETSVFIQHLVIRDSVGKRWQLPAVFAFHIGKEVNSGEWNLDIETAEEGLPTLYTYDGSIVFENYPLSKMVEELLEVRPSRLVFENMEEDPILNLRFDGESYRKKSAYEIILRSLMKKYGFSLKNDRVKGRVIRLQVNYDEKLLEMQYEGPEVPDDEKIQSFDPEGYHLLRSTTLVELSELLEDRFGEIFELYPTPYNNLPFNFSLVLDNLPSVEQQLIDDYGIQLFDGDWSYYAVKIRFIR